MWYRSAGLLEPFQSTRPRRGATFHQFIQQHPLPVSIHAPPKGRDFMHHNPLHPGQCFNPRAPEGARQTAWRRYPATSPCFNPRAPEGARQLLKWRKRLPGCEPPQRFQSTRPRRGATQKGTRYVQQLFVSIHAPPKGRDYCDINAITALFSFNPRAPEGARQIKSPLPFLVEPVSIHAPPKGRDPQSSAPSTTSGKFQSTRPRRGATGPVPSWCPKTPGFNPRAPEGARPTLNRAGNPVAARFNPRAPEGARLSSYEDQTLGVKFQSTRPRRGATSAERFAYSLFQVSIHAPPKGRDATFAEAANVLRAFQSTRPRRGATQVDALGSPVLRVSIHAPPKGRDRDRRTELL